MAVSVNQILANTLGLADPLGRIADDGRVGFNGRVNINGRPIRFAPNFDGVDDYGVLANRAINPDGDIDIEFYTPSNISADGADKFIVTQNISSSLAGHEFSLFIAGATGNLSLCVGGVVVAVSLAGEFSASEKLRLFVTGETRSVYRDGGALVRSGSIARGAAREPTAQTIIMARTNGSVGTLSRYAQGVQRDIKINGTLWRMADRNQAIQLPEPSGLGAELITPTVLENPAIKDSHWTYLGNGRWQYIGDGTYNALRLIPFGSQPQAGFIEFEVESITGAMRCYSNSNGIGTLQSSPTFTTTGVFRHYFTSRDGIGANTGFEIIRNNTASCIIKNISFKPLGTCNPMTLVNVTSDRWQEVPQ